MPNPDFVFRDEQGNPTLTPELERLRDEEKLDGFVYYVAGVLGIATGEQFLQYLTDL